MAPETSTAHLLETYETFLIDAYGVLVHSRGAFVGAEAFLREIDARRKKWLVLSNDASRLPATTIERYRGFGLEIPTGRVLTSGMLLAPYFRSRDLAGASCIVLGTADSAEYVRQAGGRPVALDDESAQVIVVADDEGYPFLEGIESVLTTLIHRTDRGETTELVLPNPDLLYPKSATAFGLTAGSVALLLERALEVRYPKSAARFVRLGKPNGAMFEEAFVRLGLTEKRGVIMLGDQLATDIDGARRFGIDSALVCTGLTCPVGIDGERAPTWVVPSL